MLAEEGEQLAPAIHCLLGPVEWPVPIEDAVASTIVAVELVHLAVLLELAPVLVHLFRARRAVVVAEYAEQRAAEVLRHFDRRDGRLGIELLLAHHHAAAPEVDACVDVFPLAGIDEGVPTTRTGAENADLAIVIGLRAYPLTSLRPRYRRPSGRRKCRRRRALWRRRRLGCPGPHAHRGLRRSRDSRDARTDASSQC